MRCDYPERTAEPECWSASFGCARYLGGNERRLLFVPRERRYTSAPQSCANRVAIVTLVAYGRSVRRVAADRQIGSALKPSRPVSVESPLVHVDILKKPP